MADMEKYLGMIKELAHEIETDDQIMREWARVIDSIPPCATHGPRCVPWCLEWINKMKYQSEAFNHG